MHIAYITYEYPPDTGKGGIGTYTWQIAETIAKLGHSVEVFTASETRQISEEVNNVLVHRIILNNYKNFGSQIVGKFSEQHQKRPFDFIECAENGANAWDVKVEYPKIPVIVRLHTPSVLVVKLQNAYLPFIKKLRFVIGALVRGKLDLGYWAKSDKNRDSDKEYLIATKAKQISAPSVGMKKWATLFWQIPAEKISVIPNVYTPSKEMLSIPINNSRRITFMGRLNVLKGLIPLTNALKIILQKHEGWQVRFIGANESSHLPQKDMKSWIKEQLQHFPKRVEFIDWIDYQNIPHFYAQTELCVFPSLFESFSYVCAEAMSAGRAVIGSNKGGMVELLNNGSCGVLVNPRNIRQLVKAIDYLINNPKKRVELGQNARRRILEEYNAEKVGCSMEAFYKNVFTNR